MNLFTQKKQKHDLSKMSFKG